MSTDIPDESFTEEPFTEEDGVLYEEEVAPQHGVLGFTIRELLIVAIWLVMFITSFFPIGWSAAIWTQGIAWILPLGVPTVAVFLIVLRRFSPDGIRRVGSLGIDQFASVAFSVAAVWWIQQLWQYIAAMSQTGTSLNIWVPWVQVVALLVLVVLTVFAPIIPGLRDDFRGRLVTLAHRNANPVRPVIARPRPERPVASPAAAEEDLAAIDDAFVDDTTHDADQPVLDEGLPLTEHASGGALGTAPELDEDYVPGYARSSRGDDETGEVIGQPFWVLAPTERDVFDETGEALFRVGPEAWVLVIEDRGGSYLVRHDDGRVGYLHDIADITKG